MSIVCVVCCCVKNVFKINFLSLCYNWKKKLRTGNYAADSHDLDFYPYDQMQGFLRYVLSCEHI